MHRNFHKVLLIAVLLFLVSIPAYAKIGLNVGYGSGSMIENPDLASKSHSELYFVDATAEWLFRNNELGLVLKVSGAASTSSESAAVTRLRAGLQYHWQNVSFFAGPTWTSYQTFPSGERTQLEGIELGGSGKLDFTDKLHLVGSFFFSPLLEGVSLSFPDADIDTWFTGNISEYYFGLEYDLSPGWGLVAGLGGWRVLDPVSQERLAVIDYRRVGVEYRY